jgi:hypothetical protein
MGVYSSYSSSLNSGMHSLVTRLEQENSRLCAFGAMLCSMWPACACKLQALIMAAQWIHLDMHTTAIWLDMNQSSQRIGLILFFERWKRFVFDDVSIIGSHWMQASLHMTPIQRCDTHISIGCILTNLLHFLIYMWILLYSLPTWMVHAIFSTRANISIICPMASSYWV